MESKNLQQQKDEFRTIVHQRAMTGGYCIAIAFAFFLIFIFSDPSFLAASRPFVIAISGAITIFLLLMFLYNLLSGFSVIHDLHDEQPVE